MKAFVQRKKNGDFPNINFAIAYDGLARLGFEIDNYYSDDQIKSIKREDIFIGFVHETKKVLDHLQIEMPRTTCYPEKLAEFYGRKIWKSTLQSFVEASNYNLFIKPIENKFFTGKWIRSFSDLVSIGYHKEEVEIWCSDPIKIQTESRCFVRYDRILDLRNYKGNWKIKPDVGVIEEVVNRLSGSLNGYAVDFGVIQEGRTIVVELNDGYSLGNYGLYSVDYCKLLMARWSQITGTKDNLIRMKE